MFHPKHHLSPNTLASLASGSSRLRAYGRLQPAQWLCTQAVGSEQGSRIREVYLNRTRPHRSSPLVHTALTTKFLWLEERGVSQFSIQAFHSNHSMFVCVWRGGGCLGGMQRMPYNGQRETSLLLGTQKETVTENRKHRDMVTGTHRNKNTDILKHN